MGFLAGQTRQRAGFRPGATIFGPGMQLFLTSGRLACVCNYEDGRKESRGRGFEESSAG